MLRTVVASLLTGSILILSSCQSVLADDNLFSDKLFPDEKSKPLFGDFNGSSGSVSSNRKPKDPAAAKKAYDEMISHEDDELRQQTQKVAGWLQEFSLRNQNRFPGVYGSSGTIERAAEVQLTELAGPNPYANATTGISSQGLNGLSPGLSYYYNSDGTPVSGSPIANSEWTAELTADNAHRISLSMDESANNSQIDQYRDNPPDNWQAPPGCISAAGNGQGFIYVWAAGIDGKPIKDYNGKTYIVAANTANNVEDQGQEAGY